MAQQAGDVQLLSGRCLPVGELNHAVSVATLTFNQPMVPVSSNELVNDPSLVPVCALSLLFLFFVFFV